ncbi:MAG: hypothetical protein ACI9MR_000558 [Myxococcota bacterium]|jgi:hypothetical protein
MERLFEKLSEPQNDPLNMSINHRAAMLEILKAYKGNAVDAGNALAKCLADNKTSFDAIKKKRVKMETDDPRKMMLTRMEARHGVQSSTLAEKTKKFTDANPALMMNEDVREPMTALPDR